MMPTKFQWTYNGTNVPGATNATLTLMNVELAQAGDYTILVSNPIGAISSPIAELKVLTCPTAPPLLSLRWQKNPAAVVLEWPADVLCYHLEMAESLRGSTWSSIPNAVVTNGVNRITMEHASGSRFFRLRGE
jgi:hypothetical protein